MSRSLRRLMQRAGPPGLLTAAVVAASALFVLVQLQPGLLVANTTPAGGDMGAHVWGPDFLKDHLLPTGRLSGWTPDWYAGFPAYQFYMVVPSLVILALDVVMPYNVAFKLVTVSGLVALPVAAWAMGRLARARFPLPALLAVATVPFVFDRSFTIYGGNAASTLAGEFAFTMSLALALVFIGLVLGGLDSGRRRGAAGITLALCVLCHLIPAIFALVAAGLAVLHRRGHLGAGRLLGGGRRWSWLAGVVVVGSLLTSFWTVPFLLRRAYLNDMGWEKVTAYWESLFPGRIGETLTDLAGGGGQAQIQGDVTFWVVLAAVGLTVSVARRRPFGVYLGVLGLLFAGAFVVAPQARLWNARLLPFWYLCLYLLAAVGMAELVRSVAVLVDRRGAGAHPLALLAGSVVATAAVLVVVGLPLRALPFGDTTDDGAYSWAGITTTDQSFIPSWARWNYSGYERKQAYPEYKDLVGTMGRLGRTEGCGRAMWEYAPDLDRFGTPMALMLLPYWTDGCIGSMEGLYFEASATTPYHFINQSELSASPSRAQRDLAYPGLDVASGVDHLKLLGARYYMAFSPEARRQAEAEPDLSLVGTSGAWRIYEVAGAGLVEPLANRPSVMDDAPAGAGEWLDRSMDWYQDPSAREVLLAASGPPAWERVEEGQSPARTPLPEVEVSAVRAGTDRIAFDVDRPGTPVLVKASYFPNWQADGADGPWRVAPNLMVVVPTDTHVEMSYGTTPVDWLGWALTALGVLGLVVLVRARRTAPRPGPPEAAGDEAHLEGAAGDDRTWGPPGAEPPPEGEPVPAAPGHQPAP